MTRRTPAVEKQFIDYWHEYAASFPMLEGDDYEKFKDDIGVNGLLVPILYFSENGHRVGLDGRNRERACKDTRLKPRYKKVPNPGSDENARIIIDGLNFHRRHLTNAWRTERVMEMRAEGKKQSEIAKAVGVSQQTVSRALESVNSGELTERNGVAKVTGTDGKQYPLERRSRLRPQRVRTSKQRDEPVEEDADKSIESFCRYMVLEFEEWKKKPVQQNNPWLDEVAWDGLAKALNSFCRTLRLFKTAKPCPRCKGVGCKSCRGVGRVTTRAFQMLT
jgi:hypothetical protein